MIPSLKLPLDFERRESVRLLVRKLEVDVAHALGIALSIWMDWATARCEFRPLRRIVNDKSEIDWKSEDLTYVLSEASGVYTAPAAPGFVEDMLSAGFIRVETRDDKIGLVLDGFWPLNEHLSPDYQSIQKRGGHAAQARRNQKEAEVLAQQQRDMFSRQQILPFGSEKTTPEEEQACLALFIRLYRICELDVPAGDKFTTEAMGEALSVIRRFSNDEILDAETWLLSNRDNPKVVKIPERILKGFDLYVGAPNQLLVG